jgi:hypothetical protein
MSPLRRARFGAGRGCQPNFSAAALSTAIDRARLKPLSSALLAVSIRMRNSIGSAFAAAAISSMNDSAAKVDCGPFGSRRLPVRIGVSQMSGRPTTSSSVRRFGIAYMSLGNASCRWPALPAVAHQLRDEHRVGLVVSEVVVVA